APRRSRPDRLYWHHIRKTPGQYRADDGRPSDPGRRSDCCAELGCLSSRRSAQGSACPSEDKQFKCRQTSSGGRNARVVWVIAVHSYVTNRKPLRQRRDGILLRDEFLAEISFVARGQNRFHNRWVIQLLRLVNLMAAGNAACMVVGDEFLV